jgi:hypothetical protein
MFVIVVPLVVGRSRAGRFELGRCFSIFLRRLFSEALAGSTKIRER